MPNLKNVLQIVVEIDGGGRSLALKQDYIKIGSPWCFLVEGGRVRGHIFDWGGHFLQKCVGAVGCRAPKTLNFLKKHQILVYPLK